MRVVELSAADTHDLRRRVLRVGTVTTSADFDGDERVVYFLNGYPVWVRTAAGTRSLAHWLVDEQILMLSDLTRVLESIDEKRWSTRKAVMELGLVAAGDLPPLLEG